MGSLKGKVLDSSLRSLVGIKRKWASPDFNSLPLTSQCQSCAECCCQHMLLKNIPGNYSNFLKSSLPQSLFFFEASAWKSYPSSVVNLIAKDFELRRTIAETSFEGRHTLFDFVQMVQIDVETGSHKPLAWIDLNGVKFFPALNQHKCGPCMHRGINMAEDRNCCSAELAANCKIVKPHLPANSSQSSTSEEPEADSFIKRPKVSYAPAYLEREVVGENEPCVPLPKKLVPSEPGAKLAMLTKGGKVYDTVLKLLLLGMGPFISESDIVGFYNVPPCSPFGKTRLGQFQKHVQHTATRRGNPNVRYAWFPSCKQDAQEIMMHGFGRIKRPTYKPSYGRGLHLTPANKSYYCARSSDVDENVVYMVLCRVILGNSEIICPGSGQLQPSDNNHYDSGTDSIQNPNHYIIWDMSVDSHVLPEYVVCFRLPLKEKADSSELIENLFGKEREVDVSEPTNPNTVNSHLSVQSNCFGSEKERDLTSSRFAGALGMMRSTARTEALQAPWLSFSMLFAAISSKVTTQDMERINVHYEEFKLKRISRAEMIKKLRLIIGDKLLISTIMHLQHKARPSSVCGKPLTLELD